MKIDSIACAWNRTKKRTLFYAWPMAISSVIDLFVIPAAVNASTKLALLTPLLGLLVFVPFVIVDMRRQRAETARENRELQAKHDAEEKAMFGKPLREFEL